MDWVEVFGIILLSVLLVLWLGALVGALQEPKALEYMDDEEEIEWLMDKHGTSREYAEDIVYNSPSSTRTPK